MNSTDLRYTQYSVCNEMIESVERVMNFDSQDSLGFAEYLKHYKKLLITGEGSSRIFPARHFIYKSFATGVDFEVLTEGCLQAAEYKLKNYVVLGISNSGKTKELISLFQNLKSCEHKALLGLTATGGSSLAEMATHSVLLKCGKEHAVAATKSVIEQALFLHSMLFNFWGIKMPDTKMLAQQIEQTLSLSIAAEIVEKMTNAPAVYFAGRNNGVAEELSLKTFEILRKKAMFLEGTFALHGIEEIMKPGELLVIIDPFESEEQKFAEVLLQGAGINIIAISTRQTCFPTIIIPENIDFQNYIELVAGWNLLVETGIAMGIDIDRPLKARKIGNEAQMQTIIAHL